MVKLSILKLMFFIFFTMPGVAYSEEASQCRKLYLQMVEDELPTDVGGRIKKWENFRGECSVHGEYAMYLADAYAANNDIMRAKNIYEKLLDDNILSSKNHRSVQEKIIRIKFKQGDNLSGVQGVLDLLNKYPDWYAGYALMGRVQVSNKNFEKAKKLFEKANSLEENSDSYLGMTIICFLEKKYSESLRDYMKAHKLRKSVILDRAATAFAVRAAIKEERWGEAESILRAQKEADKTVVNYKPYQELRAQLNEHMRKICPLD